MSSSSCPKPCLCELNYACAKTWKLLNLRQVLNHATHQLLYVRCATLGMNNSQHSASLSAKFSFSDKFSVRPY